MNLLEILSTLSIPYSKISLPYNIKQFIGVDIYHKEQSILPNIIYLTDEYVDTKVKSAFLYFEDIEANLEYAVIHSLNKEECFFKLHHYFLKQYQPQTNKISLFDNLIKGGGLKEIIEIASKLLNNPIILTNAAYKVLAINDAGCEVNDAIFQAALKYGYCSSASIYAFENEGITKRVLDSDKAVLFNTGFSKKIPRIVEKIIIDNKVVAYLGVLQVNSSFLEDDYNTIELLIEVIKNEFKRDSSLLDNTNIIYESLILELLNKQIVNPFILKERLNSSKWDTKKYYRCTLINIKKDNSQLCNVNYILNKITSYLNLKAILFDQYIIIINNYDNTDEWFFQKKFIEEESNVLLLKVITSSEFKDLLKLNDYYTKTKEVLKLVLKLNLTDTFFYFDALLSYYLISKIEYNILESCENIYYKKLHNYDKKHHTEYVKTLYYYILYNCSINETAKKLYIHRNSLTHRLEKIQEITHISLNNGVSLQNYILFCQIQYYLLKTR